MATKKKKKIGKTARRTPLSRERIEDVAPEQKIRRTATRTPLSRERIEDAALELIERDGLASFSQRVLARELGVEAMSLYHWHANRLALLNAIFDRVLSSLEMPKSGDAIEQLRAQAWSLRALALRSPKFFGQFVLPHRFNTETALAVLERWLSVCFQRWPEPQGASVFRAYVHFLMGALLDETTGYAEGPGAETPVPDAVMRERFPLVCRLAPYNQRARHEENFRFGLELMLASIVRL